MVEWFVSVCHWAARRQSSFHPQAVRPLDSSSAHCRSYRGFVTQLRQFYNRSEVLCSKWGGCDCCSCGWGRINHDRNKTGLGRLGGCRWQVAELVCLADSHASLNNKRLQSQVNTQIPTKNLHLYSVSVWCADNTHIVVYVLLKVHARRESTEEKFVLRALLFDSAKSWMFHQLRGVYNELTSRFETSSKPSRSWQATTLNWWHLIWSGSCSPHTHLLTSKTLKWVQSLTVAELISTW